MYFAYCRFYKFLMIAFMSLAYLSDNIKRNTYLLEHLLLASGLQTFIFKIKRKLAKQFQLKK